jgi:replicative DNA helicase
VLDASAKLERSALAGVLAYPSVRPVLAELTADHFYDPSHRALFHHLVDGTALDAAGAGLLAELDAHAASEGIGEATANELLLRLRERDMQRAPLERRQELSEALAKVRERAASISA